MTRHAEHYHYRQRPLLSQTPSPFHVRPPAGAAVPHRREDQGSDSLFWEFCWKLMNGVNTDLDLDL